MTFATSGKTGMENFGVSINLITGSGLTCLVDGGSWGEGRAETLASSAMEADKMVERMIRVYGLTVFCKLDW